MTADPRKFALFRGTIQVSKAHSTKQAIFTEAFECGLMTEGARDFIGGTASHVTVSLAEGYNIREVNDDR